MRHFHVVLVFVLVQIAQIVLVLVQIDEVVGLEDDSFFLKQLAPLLFDLGVGGFLERQRSAEAELFRRRESLGRLLEGEGDLDRLVLPDVLSADLVQRLVRDGLHFGPGTSLGGTKEPL